MVQTFSTLLIATVAFSAASTFAAPVIIMPDDLAVTAREVDHDLAARALVERQFQIFGELGDLISDGIQAGVKVGGRVGSKGGGKNPAKSMAKGQYKTAKKDQKHSSVFAGGISMATRELESPELE